MKQVFPKKLFKDCFEDSNKFIDVYFNNRQDEGHLHTREIDNQVIAMAYFVPKTLNFLGENIQTMLVSGVCTDSNYRNQSIMSSLLSNALIEYSNSDYVLAYLSPVNDNYYKKYGFGCAVSGIWQNTQIKEHSNYSTTQATQKDIPLLMELSREVNQNNQVYQVWNESEYKKYFDEIESYNGSIQIVNYNNKPIGWIGIDKDVDKIVLKDYSIINCLEILKDKKYFAPTINGTKEDMQICILNTPKFLNLVIPYIKDLLPLKLTSGVNSTLGTFGLVDNKIQSICGNAKTIMECGDLVKFVFSKLRTSILERY